MSLLDNSGDIIKLTAVQRKQLSPQRRIRQTGFLTPCLSAVMFAPNLLPPTPLDQNKGIVASYVIIHSHDVAGSGWLAVDDADDLLGSSKPVCWLGTRDEWGFAILNRFELQETTNKLWAIVSLSSYQVI
ncbi:hypothetical protein BPAE_0042g00420 [Botrytis paeoniae]|uniref:Uncharacterized protein n=1 Tax=Botrytis paeoniae TaxID=278948 RepID=A0A4Z1FX25_9HELO|nr:hypothetical protein BPAE_0042g00420 [Botrytis paeoniae]